MSAGNPSRRATEAGGGKARPDNLTLRVLSALVLAPLAIAIAYIGGWPFVVFWGLAAIGVAVEWMSVIGVERDKMIQLATAGVLACAAVAAILDRVLGACGLVVLGALLAAALSGKGRRLWAAVGVLYAGAVLLAPTVLRRDDALGFAALAFLFAVVWATDIFGYFCGKLMGGPKLWLRVSPKKTWSGAIGGSIGAILAGCAVAFVSGVPHPLAVAGLAFLVSAVSQAGDLFESAVKRTFGVKDASQVIPGHGGLMDRLDGFLAAAVLAVFIGLMKGGFAAPARGLLVW